MITYGNFKVENNITFHIRFYRIKFNKLVFSENDLYKTYKFNLKENDSPLLRQNSLET